MVISKKASLEFKEGNKAFVGTGILSNLMTFHCQILQFYCGLLVALWLGAASLFMVFRLVLM